MPFTVLLARAAGLRLLGLFLLFVPALRLFSVVPGTDFPKVAGVVAGSGARRVAGEVSVWEPELWVCLGPPPRRLPSFLSRALGAKGLEAE